MILHPSDISACTQTDSHRASSSRVEGTGSSYWQICNPTAVYTAAVRVSYCEIVMVRIGWNMSNK